MYKNIIVKGTPLSEGMQHYTNDSRLSLRGRGVLATIIDDVVVEGTRPRKRRWSIAHLCKDLLFCAPPTAYAAIGELKRLGYYKNEHDLRTVTTYPQDIEKGAKK